MLGTPRNISGTSNEASADFVFKTYLKDVGGTGLGPDVSSPTVHLQIDNQDEQTNMHVSFDGGNVWLPIVAGGSWDGEVSVYRFKHKADADGVAWKGIATFA